MPTSRLQLQGRNQQTLRHSQLEGGVRLGYKTDDFELAAFVRNITNDTSAVSGIAFNNFTAMVNEPRVWGVSAGVNF